MLSSCAVNTLPSGPGAQPPPRVDLRVQMPRPTNSYESTHLQQVVNVLRRYGYEPVNYGANHRLTFSIETGPVNADATIRLEREGRTIVDAFGRDGGPRIILDRAGVVRTAMDRALAQFDDQLRRVPPDWGRPTPYGPYSGGSYPGY